jgi:hypothetical protein
MDRKKAQAVLKAVESKYAEWILVSQEYGSQDPQDYPQLMENFNYSGIGRPAPFAVAWECNSPDDWAIKWHGDGDSKDPEGVFCEPIFSFVLGVYDDGEFEWDRVKRGSKFVHQRLITEDRKPETCYITRTLKRDGSVREVFYRVGDPKTGFLNKASAEYFSEHVVSFWED